MRVLLKNTLVILLLVFASVGWTSADIAPWFTKENDQIRLRVDLFLSSTCPHCQKADAFFRDLEPKKPWLEVHRYFINQDKAALDVFYHELQRVKVDNYAVPAIFFCNTRWLGFNDAGTTGQNLLRGLDYCYQQISSTNNLTSETVKVLNQLSNASLFDSNLTSKPSLSLFTLTMALTDALSSCSLFVILALVSFLWFYKERGVTIGLASLFLLTVMVVHHFQLDHTFFFYRILNSLRILVAVIGLGLVAYILVYYFKGIRNLPSFAVPILVVLTAAAVQSYQQNCTPNFGLVYQLRIDSQGLSNLTREILEVIYQLIYILPLALLVFIVIYFRSHARLQKLSTTLNYAAGNLLLIIGLFLIFIPQGLSFFSLSLAALVIALLAGWLTVRKFSRLK